MKRILIDTDTASDDVVALIMALREPSIKVEAITVGAGNVPLEVASKNARIAVERANTYAPPLYNGVGKPLLRKLVTAEHIHGKDGIGNSNLPDPLLLIEKKHAIDAIIDLIMNNPGEIEVVTLGPLMNLALAYLKEPKIAEIVKNVTIMGGAGLGIGNTTPVAEFNIYVDAEAANIVFQSGMPITLVGWDVCLGDSFITADDIDYLQKQQSPLADFCLRCLETARAFTKSETGKDGIALADPITMAVVISKEILSKQFSAYAYVETKSEATYGQVVIDQQHLLKMKPNVTVCEKIDVQRFKELLFERLLN